MSPSNTCTRLQWPRNHESQAAQLQGLRKFVAGTGENLLVKGVQKLAIQLVGRKAAHSLSNGSIEPGRIYLANPTSGEVT